MEVTVRPSPNFGPRRDGLTPELIVLHYTAMADAGAAIDWLCNPEAEVSAHYLIAKTGEVYQLVAEDQRAWHAGAGDWQGRADVNSRSIGIELDNDGFSPFAEPLMAALEALLPGIMDRWHIPPEAVIGHSDFAPARKIDPGRRFDWRRLALQGFAVWPEAGEAEVDPAAFERLLDQIGVPDAPPEVRLSAFRLRFRPWAKGALDRADMGQAADLARRFGVDRDSLNA